MSIILEMCFAIFLALLVSGSVESAITVTNKDASAIDDKENANWVTITKAPPSKEFQQSGSSIELECEVTGPQATIHWIRNNNMDNIIEDGGSNLIKKPSPEALVRLRSRLIIEDSSSSERTFTCVGRSGNETAYSSTTIYSVPGRTSQNTTELPSVNHGAKKPKIVFYYDTVLDFIGTNVELPCKATGRSNAKIYWSDKNGETVVDGRNHRFSVLPSGSLHISPLLWEDLGDYMCKAKNSLGEDSVNTYIYPLAVEPKN